MDDGVWGQGMTVAREGEEGCNSLPVVHLRQLYNKVEYQLSQCPTASDNYSCDIWSRASQEETVRT